MSFLSRNKLYKGYRDCIKKKRGTVNAIEFEMNELEKLEYLYQELNINNYIIGKSITFVLCDDHGIPGREVFAADFRDRTVHHVLVKWLNDKTEKYHYINDSYSCRVGKGTLYGAKRCMEQLAIASNNGTVKELYILKGDLHNCFNSFSKEKIFEVLENFIKKHFADDRCMKFYLQLARQILYHCPQDEGNYIRLQREDLHKRLKKEKSLFNCDSIHGIAIGNLTSQFFANFILTVLDRYVTEVLGYQFYGRYVDDFFIISKDKKKLLRDYKKVCKFVKSLDLEVNTNKLYIQHYKKGVPFIGYFVHWNKLNLLNGSRSRLYKRLYSVEKYLETHDFNFEEMDKIQATWNSYMGMIIHTKSQCVIKSVFECFPKLIERMREVYDFDQNYFIRIKKEIKQKRKELICSLLTDEFLFDE